MNKVKIRLLRVGYVPDLDFNKLNTLIDKSKIFSVSENEDIKNISFKGRYFDIKDFKDIYKSSDKADFTIGIVSYELQDNYFSKPFLDEKLIMLSIKDFKDFSKVNRLSSEKFALRFIYGFVSMFIAYGNRLPSEMEVVKDGLFQNNIQGCLFDLCIHKQDSLEFFKKTKISTSALNVLKSKSLPNGFLNQLQIELKFLKVDLIDQLSKWIIDRPVVSVFLTFILGIITNIVSSVLI
jgi:hypothetical protein